MRDAYTPAVVIMALLGVLFMAGCSTHRESVVDANHGFIKVYGIDHTAIRSTIYAMSDEQVWKIVEKSETGTYSLASKEELITSSYHLQLPDNKQVFVQAVSEPKEPVRLSVTGDSAAAQQVTRLLGARLMRDFNRGK